MSKVAIVVQRCHESITGGSEALAWQYACLLRAAYDVEILTTTAVDYATWADALAPGSEVCQGVTLHRFPVTTGRSPYWLELHRRLLRDFHSGGLAWSIAREEEFIRHQGPYSEALLHALDARAAEYAAVLFVTYLYPTTYFGSFRVPPSRCLLVPTLHDEPTAYLRAFRLMAWRARRILWLSAAEEALGRTLWGDVPGRVAAMAIDTDLRAPADLGAPYLLYSGRIDSSKGCDHLLDHFYRWKEAFPSDFRLVLTGDDRIGLPADPEIEYRGFVSAEEKFALMAGAAVFVMPSRWESFSVATLEAMAQRTPVLVNGECKVLAEHVALSGGGKAYIGYEHFVSALGEILRDEDRRFEMGQRGRRYVVARYQRERVQESLIHEVEAGLSGAGLAA
jgi:glycosyltransferase involved in cell wall biosynthesis